MMTITGARYAARITLIAITGALVLLLLLPACSVLQPATDQASRAIKRYCNEVPIALRHETRTAINLAAAPHAAHIHCDGDPSEP